MKYESPDIRQILSLLENSPAEERVRLLEQMKSADPAKAALLKARLLTVERVYLLDDETLGRILEDLDTQIFGMTLRGLDPELRQRALDLVDNDKRKQALETVKRKDLSEAQLESARRQMIQKARQLEVGGKVHFGSLARVALKKAA